MWETRNPYFREHKDSQHAAHYSPLAAHGLLSPVQVLTLPSFGSKATSDGKPGELSPTLPDKSIPEILFFLHGAPLSLKIHTFGPLVQSEIHLIKTRTRSSMKSNYCKTIS